MRIPSVLVVLIGVMACTGKNNPQPVVADRITKKEVHDIMSIWVRAMLDNRLEPQQQLLDDTWIYSGSDDGTTTTKEKALAGFTPGETTLKNIILRDTVIRLYDNFAIVTGREELVFVEQNDTNRVHLRFTDVFLKNDGKVTAVSTHSSPINTSSTKS